MYSGPCSKQMQPYSASPPPSPSEICFKHPITQCPFQLFTHKHAPYRMAHRPRPPPANFHSTSRPSASSAQNVLPGLLSAVPAFLPGPHLTFLLGDIPGSLRNSLSFRHKTLEASQWRSGRGLALTAAVSSWRGEADPGRGS